MIDVAALPAADVAFKSRAGRDAVHAAYRGVLAMWPVPSEHHRIRTNLGETFVVECGAADAPVLVLLHGAQANTAAYFFDVAAWAPHFRILAVDTVGEAGFSAETRAPLDTDAHARWLDAILDHFGIARATFVGTSLGGWMSLDYARRRPQRVERLVLLCPGGIGKQKNFLWRVLPLLLLGPWGINKTREMVMGPRPVLTTPFEKQFGALFELVGKHIRIRDVTMPLLTDEELAALPPLHVIIGGKDVLIDSQHTRRRLVAHCPQATITFLPEGRHYLPGQTQTVLASLGV